MTEPMDTSTPGTGEGGIHTSTPGTDVTSATGASSATSAANRSLTSATDASFDAGPKLSGLFSQKKSTPVSPHADKRVGLGRNGQVVIATTSELHMYQLTRDGSYARKWSKRLRTFNVSASCYKRVFDTGRILLQEDKDRETVLFDGNMERLGSWQQEGHLIGNLSSSSPATQERPVYRVTRQEDSARRDLQIVNETGKVVLHLRLPGEDYKWCGYLSLCESVSEGKVAVLSQHHRALDVFHHTGNHLGRVKLSSGDIDENGICCTEDFIFVVGNFQNTIYVFNWSGVYKGFKEKDSFGLSRDDKICAIQYNPGDKVLQMAVSDKQGVHSLNSYKLGDLPR